MFMEIHKVMTLLKYLNITGSSILSYYKRSFFNVKMPHYWNPKIYKNR